MAPAFREHFLRQTRPAVPSVRPVPRRRCESSVGALVDGRFLVASELQGFGRKVLVGCTFLPSRRMSHDRPHLARKRKGLAIR